MIKIPWHFNMQDFWDTIKRPNLLVTDIEEEYMQAKGI
jgi:hypothetical protein